MPHACDYTYAGFCPRTKKYRVYEQLHPESRGYIVHEFDSVEAAFEWLYGHAARGS